MENELVSIIIPVYEVEKWIQETIETIQNQTYCNWEAILIDDASKDYSSDIIKNYLSDKIKLIRLEQNRGPAFARNIGLEHAKGRFICFLDADDLWEKDKIEKQVEYMKEKECAFSYTSFYYTDDKGKICSLPVEVPEELTYEQSLKDNRILTITAMFDIEKIDKKLLEMPEIELEDMATWWNILKKGYIAYGLNQPLAYYRQRRQSRGHNKIKSAINRWKLYRRYEKIPFYKAIYYYSYYLKNAIKKRRNR